MNSHLKHDLEKLKDGLMKVATAVEENMLKSVKALGALSTELGSDVVTTDMEIDKMEVEMEEECLKVLALHQPVASDLRFVITVLKINNELEHIGDMAANIARRISFLKKEPISTIPFDLGDMTSKTITMLKHAIDSFMSENEYLALEVCTADEEVDLVMRECFLKSEELLKKGEGMGCVNYLLVCKSLERIADLCTNIAEDVIYMRHSVIVRHNLQAAIRALKEDS